MKNMLSHHPLIIVALLLAICTAHAEQLSDDLLQLPNVGVHGLRVITPQVLELTLINTAQAEAAPEQWNFIRDGKLLLPAATEFTVVVEGKNVGVRDVGFKRRPIYAPLAPRDLRIGSHIYLKLDAPVPENAAVEVKNPSGALWKAPLLFSTKAAPLRYSPALHVNQHGYAPKDAKRAFASFYLGSLGEAPLSAGKFAVLEADTNKEVFSGALKPRADKGFTLKVPPHQQVLEADFSAFDKPGRYRLAIAGLGASLPFLIDEGAAAAVARTYALGLYHQRCGAEHTLPYTRFTQGACHLAPAEVSTLAFKKVQDFLKDSSGDFKNNPEHTAPQLKDVAAGLYPTIKSGKLDVCGGHHDAGDYSKYTINSAHLIHSLVFAADALPGVAELDNLGLPESGDGKSDVLQIARHEAEFLCKLQDDDGGFFFLVYPRERRYEDNVLPDKGDPQVVYPKTTAVTAAATAALMQTATSPHFKKQFPQDAARYSEIAQRGWKFLEQATAKHGAHGRYQKITHYGNEFMDADEMAWARTEMFLATGDARLQAELLQAFDPAGRDTKRWTWVRLYEAYGCAIRGYAFAEKTGRIAKGKLDAGHLQKCEQEILAAGKEARQYADENAFGLSFPHTSKRFMSAGWFFAVDAAFDAVVAEQLQPIGGKETLLSNINFELGANPNNVVFLTGLGARRQREIVHQYARNDERVLPPSGIPLGCLQSGFPYLHTYKKDLGALCWPPDGDKENPFPLYERWGDTFNVSTEFVIVNQGRSLAAAAWLMAQSSLKTQPWRSTAGKIETTAGAQGVVARLSAAGLDLSAAQIVWEADRQQPAIAAEYTLPRDAKPKWIEAEALLPDGRRVFARWNP